MSELHQKSCLFCAEFISIESYKCKHCGEYILDDDYLHEEAGYYHFLGIVGPGTAILIPWILILSILQQWEFVLDLVKVFFILISFPLWLPLVSSILIPALSIIINRFFPKRRAKERKIYIRNRQAAQFLKRKAIVNSSIYWIVALLISCLIWTAHIYRPTFTTFDSFVETELELSKNNITHQYDLLFFTINKLDSKENEPLVFFGYFGRFTPYLGLNITDNSKLYKGMDFLPPSMSRIKD